MFISGANYLLKSKVIVNVIPVTALKQQKKKKKPCLGLLSCVKCLSACRLPNCTNKLLIRIRIQKSFFFIIIIQPKKVNLNLMSL